MKAPPFQITPKILKLSGQIHEILGKLTVVSFPKPSVKLRKENKIKTIQSSLAIEGNTLTLAQVTDIIEHKRVIGPAKDILEVKNAIQLYESIARFNPSSEQDLLKAHKVLMQGLIERAGVYRNSAVGIFKAGKVSKIAPPAKQVPELMGDLFEFLKKEKNHDILLKSCIFHYELELIHPFIGGNGRMGRLWQQLLLMQYSPIFELVAIETVIHEHQEKYYKALEQSDSAGNSTKFIEFSLATILAALNNFSKEYRPQRPTMRDRLEAAMEHYKTQEFSRKQYMEFHRGIATATASRDLALGVKQGLLGLS